MRIVTGVKLELGLNASVSHTVDEHDTAIALGSGDVPVIGTPRVLALFEEATMKALEGRLATGQSTVGMRVQVEHISPTGIGGEIEAAATLEKIEGRRLSFTVSARDRHGLIAAGKITRVLIDVDRFMSSVE